MKKLIAIVALTASVMATPALAHSFDPDAGPDLLVRLSQETSGLNDSPPVEKLTSVCQGVSILDRGIVPLF